MRLAAVILFLFSAYVEAANSFFGAKSGVRELTASNFKDRVLYNGNVTAVVFYAPWCGYCQELSSEWAKTAKRLAGIAQVAAVDCTAGGNAQLCGKYDVTAFPTIKVFQPAKLTDVDFKDVVEGKPVPKRRPKMFNYSGERTQEEITKFIVSKLRNYVATLGSDDALRWLAPNKIPRVLMLPGTRYKSILVSPLLKVLSRDYFGKMRFAAVPRRLDGTWNLLGMKAVEESQLIYMSDDKDAVVYKGAMKKREIKQFLDEQYDLEMLRRKQRGLAPPDREKAAEGLEFVVEDPQEGKLEHVAKREELLEQHMKQAEAERAAAFARHGKQMPSKVSHKSSEESSTTAHADTTGQPSEDTGEELKEEDFEFNVSEEDNGAASEEPEEEVLEDDVVLDTTITEINPELVVQEGPEAIASYFDKHHEEIESLATATSTSSLAPDAQVTPESKRAGVETIDDFTARCLRAGFHCAVIMTTNKTRDDDLRAVIGAMEGLSTAIKKTTLFDFMVVDDYPQLAEFVADIGYERTPGILWWDFGRQKMNLYNGTWDINSLRTYLHDAAERKVELDRTLPPKYLYWVTEAEVEALIDREKQEHAQEDADVKKEL